MINRTITILLLLLLLTSGINLWAWQKNRPSGKFLLVPHTYLGTAYSGGVISKKEFDHLLKAGLTAHDSLGNKYRILGFDFTYAERNLYEDSVGNLEVLIDYSSEFCSGDTVSADIGQTIYQRIKEGDTVYIDHVQLRPYPGNPLFSPADTSVVAGKGMKCVIAR